MVPNSFRERTRGYLQMTKRNRILLALTGVSGGLLATVICMRFGLSPRVASIIGGALAAAVAAIAVTRGAAR